MVVSPESVLLAVLLGHVLHKLSVNVLMHLYQICKICYYEIWMDVISSKSYLLT